MAAVLFTMLTLFSQAFRLHAETTGMFALHESVERSRHLIENQDAGRITQEAAGNGWSLSITAQVFRPEDSLRAWSLAGDLID